MKKSAIGVLVAVVLVAVVITGCDRGKPFAWNPVEVPDLTKSTVEEGRLILKDRGLYLNVVDEVEHDEIEAGLICRQDPLYPSDLRKGATVKVWKSKGSSKVEVPRMENASLNDVLRKLAEIGLYSNVEFVYSDAVAKDNVISLDPSPGTKVDKDSYVEVKVSKGPEATKTAVVPKATGMRKSSAKSKIEAVGLVARFVYRVHIEYYEGTLYYQTPKSGSVVPVGSTVTVYIATVLD